MVSAVATAIGGLKKRAMSTARISKVVPCDFASLSVVAVENNPFERKLLLGVLQAFDFKTVIPCSSADQALKEISRGEVHCVITEWVLAEKSGIDLIRGIRHATKSVSADLPILMCTGYTEIDRIVKARDAGVDEILAKPYSATELYRRLYATVFKKRPFIAVDTYVGPDRRRRQREFDGEDRRGKMGLSQDQIDSVMNASKRRTGTA